jgi:hypothetical protein
MISINGIELSNDLLLENEFDDGEASIVVNHTLGGRAITDTMPMEGGRSFVLMAVGEAAAYTGFFTRAQVKQLQAIRKARQTVSFIYEDQTFLVKIADIKVRPNVGRPNMEDDDEYTGTITLVEI